MLAANGLRKLKPPDRCCAGFTERVACNTGVEILGGHTLGWLQTEHPSQGSSTNVGPYEKVAVKSDPSGHVRTSNELCDDTFQYLHQYVTSA
jgi:hypothetical protein